MFLEILEPARLVHRSDNCEQWSGEHFTLEVEPGVYRVWRQREFLPGHFRERGAPD